MKKKITNILFIAAIIILLMPCAFAETSGECGENAVWTFENGTLTISGSGDIYGYYTYTPWEDYDKEIKKVIIEDGITNVAANSFYGCENLTEVTIPEGVTNIGSSAFRVCKSLEEIKIPSTVTFINHSAFSECTLLKKINLPESVKVISSAVFAFCPNLSDITLPPNITGIHKQLFDSSGIRSIVIPDKVSSIAQWAFANCAELSEVTMGDSVTYIGDDAFSNSPKLKTIHIGHNVNTIDYRAFGGCTGLTDIYFDGTQERWNKISINDENEPLKNAQIHFSGRVDADDDKPEETETPATPKPTIEPVSANGTCGESASWTLENGTLTIRGNGDMEEYGGYAYDRNAPWWDYRYSISELVIENGITHIGSRAFAMCTNLEKVNIANSVTSIGEYAFEYAKSLKSITIPDSVTQMGTRVFGDCENLETVNMPSKITEIKDEMFFRCFALKKINIPNGVTKIGSNAFDECEALQSITLPDGLTSIGEWAFYGCGLKSISIPDTVTTIGASAFRVCTNLKCVKLPTGIDRIDEYMFCDDTSLVKIAIPNGVEDIRAFAFADCDRLETVKIPLSVKYIDDTAFGGNTYVYDFVYDIYYSGTEEDWNKIVLASSNSAELMDLHFLSYTPSEEVFTQYDYADKVDIQQQIEDNKITLTITPLKTSADLSQMKMYVAEYTSEGVFAGLKEVEKSEPDENGAVAMSAELPNNGKIFLWDKELIPVTEPITVTKQSYVSELMSYMPSNQNYVISPLSLKMAMLMAANGAEGITKTEMLSAFDVKDLNRYNTYAKSLVENLNDNRDGAEINIANSIWFNEDYYENIENADFSNDFKNAVSEYYLASNGVVAQENIIDTINKWIDEQTNGKLQNVVNAGNLDPKETLLAIVNAVYMKARWTHEFDKSDTNKDIFTDIDGNENSIDFMSQTDYFDYMNDGDIKIVSLPYRNGFRMDIVIGVTQNYENAIKNLENKKVHISIPKFSVEYFVNLEETLKKMGVVKAFSDNNSDFNSMVINVPEPIKINSVFQKAIIDVDEEGTEAAAVTVIGNAGAGANEEDEEEVFEFKADEPFIYFIRDNNSDEILFAGRYVKCN